MASFDWEDILMYGLDYQPHASRPCCTGGRTRYSMRGRVYITHIQGATNKGGNAFILEWYCSCWDKSDL
jgi:hypothetical protein